MHPPEIIEEGIRRLGRAVERLLARREKPAAAMPQQKGVVI
jgi:hypothetical protein